MTHTNWQKVDENQLTKYECFQTSYLPGMLEQPAELVATQAQPKLICDDSDSDEDQGKLNQGYMSEIPLLDNTESSSTSPNMVPEAERNDQTNDDLSSPSQNDLIMPPPELVTDFWPSSSRNVQEILPTHPVISPSPLPRTDTPVSDPTTRSPLQDVVPISLPQAELYSDIPTDCSSPITPVETHRTMSRGSIATDPRPATSGRGSRLASVADSRPPRTT